MLLLPSIGPEDYDGPHGIKKGNIFLNTLIANDWYRIIVVAGRILPASIILDELHQSIASQLVGDASLNNLFADVQIYFSGSTTYTGQKFQKFSKIKSKEIQIDELVSISKYCKLLTDVSEICISHLSGSIDNAPHDGNRHTGQVSCLLLDLLRHLINQRKRTLIS